MNSETSSNACRWLQLISLALLAGLTGCANLTRGSASADAFLGAYSGGFDGAATPEPTDDINYNPCEPGADACEEHHAPLSNIVLRLHKDPDGAIHLTLYQSLAELKQAVPLDPLGRGCGTSIGPMQTLTRHDDDDGPLWTADFPVTAQSRHCLGKLRPTSTHTIHLEMYDANDTEARYVQAVIDKAVVSTNYMYVVEDGVQRRVKLDLRNSVGEGRRTQYRVCIENDLGEYDRCVLTDKKLKQLLLPVPLPGGAAVSYTWWYDLYPNLKRTRGLYRLEQYTGRFDSLDD